MKTYFIWNGKSWPNPCLHCSMKTIQANSMSFKVFNEGIFHMAGLIQAKSMSLVFDEGIYIIWHGQSRPIPCLLKCSMKTYFIWHGHCQSRPNPCLFCSKKTIQAYLKFSIVQWRHISNGGGSPGQFHVFSAQWRHSSHVSVTGEEYGWLSPIPIPNIEIKPINP